MINFLKKLDRQAGSLLDTMDEQLGQPINQVMTGEVFTHDTESEALESSNRPVTRAYVITKTQENEARSGEQPCPPVLRKANA